MKNTTTCAVRKLIVSILISLFLVIAGPSISYSLEPLSIEEAKVFLKELNHDPNPFKQQNYSEYLAILMESAFLTEYPPAILQVLAICLTERITPVLSKMTPAQLSEYSQGDEISRAHDDKIFNECWEELQNKIEKNK